MTYAFRRCFLACSLLLSVLSSPARAGDAPTPDQAPPLVAGYWEVVTAPNFPGIPMPMLPRTERYCITPEQIAQGTMRLMLFASCRLQGSAWQGNRLPLVINCPELVPPPKTEGELNAAGKSFTARATVVTGGGETPHYFYYHHTARWLGEHCPEEIQRPQPPAAAR